MWLLGGVLKGVVVPSRSSWRPLMVVVGPSRSSSKLCCALVESRVREREGVIASNLEAGMAVSESIWGRHG
eukprot:1897078-Pyramimonas_sp.AAC.1